MAEARGRPDFDLSSFLTFTLPNLEQNEACTGISAVLPKGESIPGSDKRQESQGADSAPPEAVESKDRVDLAKYGSPDALVRLNQVVPPLVKAIIDSSIDSVRAQVAAEAELHRQQKEEEEAWRQIEERGSQSVEEGRKSKEYQSRPDDTPAPRVSADHTDSESFYTPSEGRTIYPDSPSETETEIVSLGAVTEQASLDASIMPRPTALSTSALYPRRRDLLKAVLRKIGDTDTRRRVLHRSTGALRQSEVQLRAKFRHARQVLQHQDVESSECISCFDDFALRDLVQLRCHNYCKPCFERLIAHSIATEAQWPPKCCLNPIDHRKCLRHISGELEQQYRQKHVEYLTPIDKRYYCPVPDCGVFVPMEKIDAAYGRAKCARDHLTCVNCRELAHDDTTQCVKNQDMKLVQRLAQEQGWRRCYRCHTMVEHKNACRHITCRCGAEFCYVCGKVWYTCGCTERQLDQIKTRARANEARQKQEEKRQRKEIEELQRALEAIAQMEAVEAEKRERIRLAKEVQRERQVRRMYAEASIKLDEVNCFQKEFLDGQHRRDQDHLSLRILVAMDGLGLKHAAKLDQLRASSKAKMEGKEREWEQDWQERIAREKKAEDHYETQLVEWAKSVKNGEHRKDELLEAQRTKHAKGRDVYTSRREDELERLRWVLDEEVAIEQELMDAKKARIKESFNVQERELQAKIESELRWCELVVPERGRLLQKLLEDDLADELVDDADDRWGSFIVKEEAEEAGPSRFRSVKKHARG